VESSVFVSQAFGLRSGGERQGGREKDGRLYGPNFGGGKRGLSGERLRPIKNGRYFMWFGKGKSDSDADFQKDIIESGDRSCDFFVGSSGSTSKEGKNLKGRALGDDNECLCYE